MAEQESKGIGEVKIAAEVVAAIAGLAALEVDGVFAMAGNITNELIGKLGKKNLSKGVKVQMEDGVARVDMMLNIRYGYNIPKVTVQVQERVASQIETMTGMSVQEVNIRVAAVNLSSNEGV